MRYYLGVKHRLREEWGISALYSQVRKRAGYLATLPPLMAYAPSRLGPNISAAARPSGLPSLKSDLTTQQRGLEPRPLRGSTETGQGLSRSVSAIAFKVAHKIAIGIWQVFRIDLPKQGFGKGGRPYGNAL